MREPAAGRQRGRLRLALAIALLVTAVSLVRSSERDSTGSREEDAFVSAVERSVDRGPSSASSTQHVESAHEATLAISPEDLAPSLRGTEIDGDFDRDASGRVVFGPSLVRLFDYLRATLGEASEDEIRAFLERLARARLGDAEEVARVLLLYDRYVAMLDEAEDRIPASRELEDEPEGALELLHAIRVSSFGEEDAERAFGESERIARGLFARARVLGDVSLSAEERTRRLDAIAETLPAHFAESWRTMRVPERLRETTDALRAAGASEAAVQEARVREVGSEAAGRLAALDTAREAWAARVSEYRSALDDLHARSAGTPPEASIEALRARYFEGTELARIAALDRIER